MKVKVSAMVTYETEISLDWYSEVKNGPTSEDEILAYEQKLIADGDTCWIEALFESGTAHNLKLESVEEEQKCSPGPVEVHGNAVSGAE